jgi:hypothetical protein
MWSGYRRFSASPECHLTSIGSIEDVPFYSGSELTTRGDLVCWMLHEIREIVHGFSFKLGAIRRNRTLTKLNLAHRSPQIWLIRTGRGICFVFIKKREMLRAAATAQHDRYPFASPLG